MLIYEEVVYTYYFMSDSSRKFPLDYCDKRICINHLAQNNPVCFCHYIYALKELSKLGQVRASRHWSPEGKRSGERKPLTFHLLKLGMICVQPDKHWHCFEGELGETAERWDRTHKSLSKPKDAILSRNWNWNCKSVYRSQLCSSDKKKEENPPKFVKSHL